MPWLKVTDTFSEIFTVKLPTVLVMALFEVLPNNVCLISLRTDVLCFISLQARLNIATLEKYPPPIHQHLISHMEIYLTGKKVNIPTKKSIYNLYIQFFEYFIYFIK